MRDKINRTISRLFCAGGCCFLWTWMILSHIESLATKPVDIAFFLGITFLFDGLVLYG